MIYFDQEKENAIKMWKDSLLIVSQLEQDLKVMNLAEELKNKQKLNKI